MSYGDMYEDRGALPALRGIGEDEVSGGIGKFSFKKLARGVAKVGGKAIKYGTPIGLSVTAARFALKKTPLKHATGWLLGGGGGGSKGPAKPKKRPQTRKGRRATGGAVVDEETTDEEDAAPEAPEEDEGGGDEGGDEGGGDEGGDEGGGDDEAEAAGMGGYAGMGFSFKKIVKGIGKGAKSVGKAVGGVGKQVGLTALQTYLGRPLVTPGGGGSAMSRTPPPSGGGDWYKNPLVLGAAGVGVLGVVLLSRKKK